MRVSIRAWTGKSCLAEMRGSIQCMWRRLLAIAAILSIIVATASAQTAEQIKQVAEETIRELNLQTSLPVRDDSEGWMLNLPAFEYKSELFWIALVIIVAFLIYQMRDELPTLIFKRTGNWQEDSPGIAGGADEEGVINPSLTADELAGQGRYIEAMHWLLLGALAEIRERLGIQFPDSMTSREILRRASIPAEGKRRLKDIITRVELSYFGDYPAGEQDFAACRTSFDHLLAELRTEPQSSVPAS